MDRTTFIIFLLVALILIQFYQLNQLKNLGAKMDAKTQDILKRLDSATNAVASRIAALIANQSTTAEEFRAALEPEVARLESFASDPANPVPVETPPTV